MIITIDIFGYILVKSWGYERLQFLGISYVYFKKYKVYLTNLFAKSRKQLKQSKLLAASICAIR